MLTKITRLLYTLQPLKPVQIWGLFYYRIFRRIFPFKVPTAVRMPLEQHQAPFHRYQPASWLGEEKFYFLNNQGEIDAHWQAPGQSLLWLYNLHYFDHLHADGAKYESGLQGDLITNWWQVHKGTQNFMWDPYPTSLRAVNFCKWGWLENSDFYFIAENDFSELLARHYIEIKRKLEIHIQANHLFANLKALWFLQAALMEYRVKDAPWLCTQVLRELDLQFDQDGGHFELSPMYHRIMLWDMLDMLALGRKVNDFAVVLKKLQNVIEKALVWVQAMAHPDTEVAFFNDSSIGIAPTLDLILDYAQALGLQVKQPANGDFSGYVVQEMNATKLICDMAEVGPKFQPGHAHADTLSFELSIGQQRILVNSGTSEYGANPERLRQRSTAAHNTVVFNGCNSSDVWSGFRVAKAARIVQRNVTYNEAMLKIKGSHNGYAPAVHIRQWKFIQGQLIVEDSMPAKGVKISYFHLHPNVQISQVRNDFFVLDWSEGSAELRVCTEKVDSQIVTNTWHPEFGKVVPNQCLILTWDNDQCVIEINWA